MLSICATTDTINDQQSGSKVIGLFLYIFFICVSIGAKGFCPRKSPWVLIIMTGMIISFCSSQEVPKENSVALTLLTIITIFHCRLLAG